MQESSDWLWVIVLASGSADHLAMQFVIKLVVESTILLSNIFVFRIPLSTDNGEILESIMLNFQLTVMRHIHILRQEKKPLSNEK